MTIAATARKTNGRTTDRTTGQPASLFIGQSTTGPGLPEPSADDVVQDMLATIARLAPSIPAEVLHQADRAVRDMWGGSRPYISKRLGEGRSQLADAIRRSHAQGNRVGAICRLHHVSRATVYRVLGMPEEA